MGRTSTRHEQTLKGRKRLATHLKSREINIDLRAKPKPQLELIKRQLKGLPNVAMPVGIQPMLATLVKAPFNDPDWLFELKWDGYRATAYINNGNVQLRSRRDQNYNHYKPVADALQQIRVNAVLDGEIVVLDEEGKADFSALEKWRQNKEGHLVYYVFDLLWLNGIDLTSAPLIKRKEILSKILPQNDAIRYSDGIEEIGINFFEVVKKNGLEGIVAKRKDSFYQTGKRSSDWLKIVTAKRQEFVIGGWTESSNSRQFKSILFGYYDDKGNFLYFGHSGHGFKEKDMPLLLKLFKEYEIKKSAFANETDRDDIVHFMKPELVGVFEYKTVTLSGKIRHPAIFLGFREDKEPTEVRLEDGTETDRKEKKEVQQKQAKKETGSISKENFTAEDSNWKVIERIEVKTAETKTVGGKKVEIINPAKRLWGSDDEPITKADLLRYYHAVYKYIAPHLKDRPLSLHIKHIAPTVKGLYIKDMEGRAPEWAEVFTVPRKHKKKGKRDIIDYLVCNNEATLQYIVSLGCIDINPWTSRINNYLQPDFIIIDLDPSDGDFRKVIRTAVEAKKLFDKHKLKVFPKTSGKTGLHLYIPCEGFSFAEARSIAVNISKEISLMIPDIATSENTIEKRGDKVFIDYNQNDEADTVAAPYSVRPSKAPTVSTPLEWKEINDKLHPGNFDIHNILERIKKKGDLFKAVMDDKTRRTNTKILKEFV